MKRLFGILFILQFCIIGWSQTITIDFKNGSFQKYDMNEIESVTFSQDEDTSQEQNVHPTDEKGKELYSDIWERFCIYTQSVSS